MNEINHFKITFKFFSSKQQKSTFCNPVLEKSKLYFFFENQRIRFLEIFFNVFKNKQKIYDCHKH